ncbi:hypothetical protein [Methylophaga sp. OBS4]|uniref:hypothetical protein n=1 Tax=Methylophaga sp. OBS4 TaxID=2991935 RepID=UPI0022523654|nr:hypothetical protein [Methylophaga sp. OBS4]MCX4187403.1 hypothetical protein [Methylophaga sp. OBS4]
MKNKAQELELRHIMEGLEEFATFMSFQSDYEGLRILSVETTQEAKARDQRAKVISLDSKRRTRSPQTNTISKELRFCDQSFH